MTNNLYKQDAYCVYACGNGYYTYKDQMQCVKECPVGTFGLLTNISCMALNSMFLRCIIFNIIKLWRYKFTICMLYKNNH